MFSPKLSYALSCVQDEQQQYFVPNVKQVELPSLEKQSQLNPLQCEDDWWSCSEAGGNGFWLYILMWYHCLVQYSAGRLLSPDVQRRKGELSWYLYYASTDDFLRRQDPQIALTYADVLVENLRTLFYTVWVWHDFSIICYLSKLFYIAVVKKWWPWAVIL